MAESAIATPTQVVEHDDDPINTGQPHQVSALLDYLRTVLAADATLLTRREGRYDHCVEVSAPAAALVALIGHRVSANLPHGRSTAVPVVDHLGQRLGTLVCLTHRRVDWPTQQCVRLMRAAATVLAASWGVCVSQPTTPPRHHAPGLTTVLQPIIDLSTGAIIAVEALSRFPGDPPPAPDDVFGLAAASRLSEPLEMAAIESALAQLALLPPHVKLYVNASPAIAANPTLSRLLTAAGPRRLVLELTEYDDADPATLIAALDPLRRAGLQIAVDDLGTGHAHLNRLIRLRPDVVKLDRTLTTDIHRDPYRQALLRGFVGFAAETGSRLIAEGIEQRAQAEALRALGIRYGQGYYLAAPQAPSPALTLWITHSGTPPVRPTSYRPVCPGPEGPILHLKRL